MNLTTRFLVVILLSVFCMNIGAATPQQLQQPATQDERLRFEREKLAFERSNEERKANYELIKSIITAVALFVPILLGIYTVHSQIRSAQELKRIEAQTAFELKAAEIVMDVRHPGGVKRQAKILQALFPDRLPSNFVETFNPHDYYVVGPRFETKFELLKLLVANPGKEHEIVALWRRMFPKHQMEQLFPGDYETEHNETDA